MSPVISIASVAPLRSGEVHVWFCSLSDFSPEAFSQWLAPDERARMERFKVPEVRARFAVARGILRLLAGRYLGRPPESLTFRYGIQGKPELDGLQFNVSHSGWKMAAAFAADGPLGLDIEEISPRLRARDIAERYFSVRERGALETTDEAEYLRRFYRFWTAKEAVMKATGLGFALPLSDLEIGLAPLRLVALRWEGSCDWELRDVSPGDDCAGTLACWPGAEVKRFDVSKAWAPM